MNKQLLKRYETSTYLNNEGFYHLAIDVINGKITGKQIKEMLPLLKQEQRRELIEQIYSDAQDKALMQKEINLRHYMEDNAKSVLDNLIGEPDFPF